MKHILLTLVAAATAATASDTPAEAVQVRLQDAVITHYDSSSITSQGSTFSVAITLDVSGLRVLLEAGQQDTLRTDIICFSTGETQTGVATGGSPGANNTIGSSCLIGFIGYDYGIPNINYSENLADLNGDQEGTGWDNAAYAGMVYTHDAVNGSSVYFTILDKDNKELTQSSYITNAYLYLKSSATHDSIAFHSSTTATFYYDMALNAHQAQALAIAAASVPEPATAMLSLLALAGVAARRRR